MALTDRLLDAWYNGHPALTLLRPLEALYRRVVNNKRARFVAGQGEIYKAPVPVIVVGNITVGGTGKTPLILWMIDYCRKRGQRVGVVSRGFQLVGVGHLAFAPPEPGRTGATAKQRVAEFGVSVSKSARGQGVGSRLFERAAIHCRNSDIDTLYMQCLSSNRTMMHIAKKAGMEIKREYGEADAYLHLPPPSPGSVMREALEEQFAVIDYTVKANARAAVKWFRPRKRP